MQEQPKVSLSPYNTYPSTTEGEDATRRSASFPLQLLPGVGGSPPASLDRLWNKCVDDGTSSNPKKRWSFCPNSPGHFILPAGNSVPARCNSWGCSFCSPAKKHRYLDRIARGTATGGYRWRFLTLTQATSDPMPIMTAWARWRRYMHNDGWSRLKYVWVKEFTRKGKRHLHILVNAYVPQALIKKNWLRATRQKSFIVHIVGKDEDGIKNGAGYMSKYLSKNIESDHEWRKYERRFGFSRWDAWREPEKPPSGARFILMPIFTYQGRFTDMTLVSALQARKLSLRELHEAIKNDREFDDALDASITDAINRHAGTPIDSLPWDETGRPFLPVEPPEKNRAYLKRRS